MTLRFGREMVAIPGPSIIPDRVLNAMHRPMPNIYDGPLVEVTDRILERLPAIARTTTATPFMVIGNGHAAWQMAICNTLSRGDRVLALESGRFAVSWGEMAEMSGCVSEVLPGSWRQPVDPAALEARLRDDVNHEIKAVLVVLTDTATSVTNDIEALRAAIDAAGHPALFMVDCIASLGCEPFEMDSWGVDVAVAASQKGLMVPPGLGIVWAGSRALAAHADANLRISYVDWEVRMNATAHYEIYAGTPPISHLYGLAEALDMIDEEGGVEAVWARHRVLADAVHAAVSAWSTPGALEFNIEVPSARSTAVTTIRTGSVNATQLREVAQSAYGLTLGLGIGGMDDAFRIGHMGHLNPPMLLGTIGTVEASLARIGAPIGSSGAGAAAAVIGQH